jgi:hypothetical protein
VRDGEICRVPQATGLLQLRSIECEELLLAEFLGEVCVTEPEED